MRACDAGFAVAHETAFAEIEDLKTLLKLALERLLDRLGLPRAEVSLLLCDDAHIRTLNQRFRQEDRATDVLAFPGSEERPLDGRAPGRGRRRTMQHADAQRSEAHREVALGDGALEGPPLLLGDIVISLPYARRQATALAVPLRSEVLLLAVHALLHLLGFDHGDTATRRRMWALSDALLANLVDLGAQGTGRFPVSEPAVE